MGTSLLKPEEVDAIIEVMFHHNISSEVQQNHDNNFIITEPDSKNPCILKVTRTDSEGRRLWEPARFSLKNLLLREIGVSKVIFVDTSQEEN